jgi:glycosyltransferase involved in cell wall biosynthesis
MHQSTDTALGLQSSTTSTGRYPRPEPVEISVVMPCLNEESTVGQCVSDALATIAMLGLSGEVIVVDNASTDNSACVARAAGARVVEESLRGYGRAFIRGFEEASGSIIVLADSDGSHDLSDMERLIKPLASGQDFVIGSRIHTPPETGAIPWLHRRVGGPALTRLLNVIYRTNVSDAHCGFRAVTSSALRRLDLTSPGMEFASEMIVEAVQNGLSLAEVPVTALPRAGGEPKLRTWRDGTRHLLLLLRRANRARLPRGLTGTFSSMAPADEPANP